MSDVARAICLEEFFDPEPTTPALADVPDEPDLEFTRIFHTRVCYCGECRAVYSGLHLIDRVALFVEHGGRPPFTATWAQTKTPCPHCLTARHSDTQARIRRENATLSARYTSEHQRWLIREAARGGIVPGRKRRAIRLGD